MQQHNIKYYDEKTQNPADRVLRDWESKGGSTVGKLYDYLIDLDLQKIADCL